MFHNIAQHCTKVISSINVMLSCIPQVEDKFRNEVAIGSVTIKVVDLTEEALMQSGSFRVEGYSSTTLLEQQDVSSLLVFYPN